MAEEENSSGSFLSIMGSTRDSSDTGRNGQDSDNYIPRTAKEKLEKIKEEEKKKREEELNNAKKDSLYKSGHFNKSGLMKARGQQFAAAYIFLAFFGILFLMVIFRMMK